jgi:lysylphosphatidylglycerol synthetase-like protein (DUF2156 family)
MTDPKIDETKIEVSPETGTEPALIPPDPTRHTKALLQLPGLTFISLYMLVLAGINILGVASGQLQPALLIFSALFIAAGLGLLMLLRWAWALTLAAMVLLVGLFVWRFATSHDFPYAVQGLLNLVFFLYLVRIEVREKLR